MRVAGKQSLQRLMGPRSEQSADHVDGALEFLTGGQPEDGGAQIGIGDVGVEGPQVRPCGDEGSGVELVERPHPVTLDGPLAPRRQIVDHDKRYVDHVVVGIGQEVVGVAGEWRGDAPVSAG